MVPGSLLGIWRAVFSTMTAISSSLAHLRGHFYGETPSHPAPSQAWLQVPHPSTSRRAAISCSPPISAPGCPVRREETRLIRQALAWFWLQVSQSVQLLSCVWLSATPWTTARQASLSITNSQSSLKFTSIKSVMPPIHLILCRSLLLPTSIFPSIRIFSNKLVHSIRWPKYWSFSFSISPSNEHPGLISFRMDWLDLLAVQGTLRNLLQHHSSKVSILRCSAFFIVQLSHPYMTTGKAIALTRGYR